VGGLKEVRAK
jgi:hypothetical protein